MSQLSLLSVERALSGLLPVSDLTLEESKVFRREKPMFDIGRMAELSVHAYYAHCAAILVANNPASSGLLNGSHDASFIPTEAVLRKDGSAHIFDSKYYLQYLHAPELSEQLASIWLMGALLSVGDALENRGYFDRLPELELLYHLRNGVAHGNKFHFNCKGKQRLQKYPAHNRDAKIRVPGSDFEIVLGLEGSKVLFDFMGPGDVLDLLLSIAVRFMRLRERL